MSVYNGPHAEKDSIEPIDGSDSVSDSDGSRSTQFCTVSHILYISLTSFEVRDSSTFSSSSFADKTQA